MSSQSRDEGLKMNVSSFATFHNPDGMKVLTTAATTTEQYYMLRPLQYRTYIVDKNYGVTIFKLIRLTAIHHPR